MLPAPKKKKRPADMNELAFSVVADLTGETAEEEHAAAVERGRVGGKKGGQARKERLTPERRREIAKKAAEVRWGKYQT